MLQAAGKSHATESTLDEILRVLKLCDPVLETAHVLTFTTNASSLSPAWSHWLDNVFLPHLGPALLECIAHASADHAHDVIAADGKLSDQLAGPLKNASIHAGRQLILGFTVPNGARVLGKLRHRTETGSLSPHFATVFAARSALFGIAPSQAVAGYLFKEWQCGIPGGRLTSDLPEMDGVFEKISHARATAMDRPQLHVVSH